MFLFSYPLPLPPPPIVSLLTPLNYARHNSILIPLALPQPNYDYDYDYDSDSNGTVQSQVYYHSSTRASQLRKRGRRLNRKVPSRRELSFSSSSYPSPFIDILSHPSLLPSSIFCFPQPCRGFSAFKSFRAVLLLLLLLLLSFESLRV